MCKILLDAYKAQYGEDKAKCIVVAMLHNRGNSGCQRPIDDYQKDVMKAMDGQKLDHSCTNPAGPIAM